MMKISVKAAATSICLLCRDVEVSAHVADVLALLHELLEGLASRQNLI